MGVELRKQCACKKMGNAHALCFDEFTFQEAGKSVRLQPGRDEKVTALVLDGCVFNDQHPRCDGLFLWKGRKRRPQSLLS